MHSEISLDMKMTAPLRAQQESPVKGLPIRSS